MAVVAARQGSSPAFRRRTAVRRYRIRLAAASGPVLALVFGFIVADALGIATTTPASAQGFTYNPRPPRPVPPRAANDGGEHQRENGPTDASQTGAIAAHGRAPPERGQHSLAGGDNHSHYPSSWYSKAKKPVRPPTNTGSHAAAIGCINSALLKSSVTFDRT